MRNRTYRGQTIDAVRLGDWKLLQDNPFGAQELYNLAEDPYETRDLFEQQPEKAWELNRILMRHRQNGGRVPWQPPDLYHPF